MGAGRLYPTSNAAIQIALICTPLSLQYPSRRPRTQGGYAPVHVVLVVPSFGSLHLACVALRSRAALAAVAAHDAGWRQRLSRKMAGWGVGLGGKA